MNHNGSSHVNNGLNCMLSDNILMFCTNTKEALRLILELAIVTEQIISEGAIITVQVRDISGSNLLELFFKPVLGHNCFTSTQRNLTLNLHEASYSILEDSAGTYH